MSALILTLGLLLAAAPVIEEADLTAKPSGREVGSVFPLKSHRNIHGAVKMRCTIDAAGKAERCDVLTEKPYGLGFGEAGARLMERSGRFKPRKVDGKAVDGGQVEFTLEMWAPKAGPPLLTDPVWATAPTVDEVAAAWPAGLQDEEAVVVLRCLMRRSGDLGDCTTVQPADPAATEAARALAGRFRVKLTEAEVRKVSRADVVISFRLLNPASAAGKSRLVRQPEWTTVLDPAAVQAIFPDAAAAAGVKSGRGVADCLVGADGALSDCRVASEKPDALGFGASAVEVAQTMRLNLWSEDGRPTVGARIRLPVEFSLAADPAK
ncbi:MAG TPA: energy transducer TonB [Caulobacter sp.]|nr:energy transducer TonB [Caulobacter sp.]